VLMPVVRQGPAPDEIRTGGSQPAHQSMSTDVQQARLLPCTTLSTSGTTVDRGWKIALILLKTDIRERCGGDGAGFELMIDAAADPAVKPPGG
jgi:hypothetical protein